MRRAHPVAAVVEDPPRKDSWRPFCSDPPLDGVCGQLCLHGVEQGAIDDGLMLPAMNLATIDDFTDVEAVLEQVGERSHPEPNTAAHSIIRATPLPRPYRSLVKVVHQRTNRA